MINGLLVESNEVVNVALFNSAEDLFAGWIEQPEGEVVGKGWTTEDDGLTFNEPPEVVLSVRNNRQRAYIDELSEEGTFDKTIGDMISAIVDHIDGKPEALSALTAQIKEIRERFPKQDTTTTK